MKIIKKALIADKNENFLFVLNNFFKSLNYEVFVCNSYEQLKGNLNNYDFSYTVLDQSLLLNWQNFMKEASKYYYNTGFIILCSQFFHFDTLLYENMKVEFLKKPFSLDDLIKKINLLDTIGTKTKNSGLNNFKIPLIEKTEKTKNIFESIKKVVSNNFNTLITGESGTGKREIANTINEMSSEGKQILTFNAIDYKNQFFEDIILKKINATKVLSNKQIIEEEISDIILLSDIDQMPLKLQVLFANFLKQNVNKENILFKKRYIATSSKNIKQSLRNNNFSSELFYKLDMYNIFTLPLRERAEDVKVLIGEFVNEFNKRNNTFKKINNDAILLIEGYLWPGNITQLKNFITKCLTLNSNDILSKTFISKELDNEFKYYKKSYMESWNLNFSDIVSKNIRGYLNYNSKINTGIYYRLLKEFEKPLIIEILKYTNNNQLLSSELLGINRNTLRKKMSDYDIQIVKKSQEE